MTTGDALRAIAAANRRGEQRGAIDDARGGPDRSAVPPGDRARRSRSGGDRRERPDLVAV